jgi:hypothetical protein
LWRIKQSLVIDFLREVFGGGSQSDGIASPITAKAMPARVFGGAARRLDIDGMTQPVTGRPGSCGRPLRALQNDADNVLYAVR